ncbi:ubiquitin-like modifier-activating enzyme 1 isoform X2 [Erpetoichthys calabaricus]|uniref:ubiquitin-like modifier-activating enzyme 1 isoform X2 n=1 Tax=Erpetoichthys calabaricus TaxID=27687 RepID=UPI002234B1A1|nr:ubiquitin-like modifier-activating enzyme 1 isoform X2 [Erpetoichthys calabaricus]
MSETAEIDESLYSRQLYVLGHKAMLRLQTTNVLISGMRGLGAEIAKNVVLAGVRSVTVHDEGEVQWGDLSSQFFLKESDVGKNRAKCCEPHLAELNAYVQVASYTGSLNEHYLSAFQVVVLTNSSLDEQLQIGTLCHSKNIRFIVADTKGLCGLLFCDFGEEFVVSDPNGEQPLSAIVLNISKDNPGVVTCLDEEGHGFQNGDQVTFSGLFGMTELNNCTPVKIEVLNDYEFSISDTSGFMAYENGGMVTEVKMSQTFSFKPLSESIEDPEIVMTDSCKKEQHKTLHVAFQALHNFVQRTKRLPKPRGEDDAQLLIEIAKQIPWKCPVNEEVVRKFAFGATGDLSPVNAFIGGLAAHEVMKACSGKFTPLRQWLYFDALECLPEDASDCRLTEETCSPRGSRYDGQIAVFGSAFQEKLSSQKLFMVGAGAIGCELLKNFAMMGLATEEGGNVTVTDMDSIENSNLNRQFLFRPRDVGKMKSITAAEAVRKMNPSLRITAHQDRLGPETSDVYGYQFFSKLDVVFTALDSVEARVYVDGCCVEHQKPLLESGTLGTKGHTQVILPFLTRSYGQVQDSQENAFPLCTLKNFPFSIEHTLQWARDIFEQLFKTSAENVSRYFQDPGFVKNSLKRDSAEALGVLEEVYDSLVTWKPNNWTDCVSWARNQWERLYNNNGKKEAQQSNSASGSSMFVMADTQDERQGSYADREKPPDKEDFNEVLNSGKPFWLGPKRWPRPLNFDPDNATHMSFIEAAANLFAETYGIKGTRNHQEIAETLKIVIVPEFTPKSGVQIITTDDEMKEATEQSVDDNRLEEVRKKLDTLQKVGIFKMYPIEFEKDDDTNLHVDFIVAASNLRAENYYIPPADRHKSKLIVGKIIPAIATTTAAVVGLVCLELYKVIQGHKELSLYRDSFINLATADCFLFLPSAAPVHKVAGLDLKFTLWDHFPVHGYRDDTEMTVEELLSHVKKNHSLEVTDLFYENAAIYLSESKNREERLRQRVSEAVRAATKKEIPETLSVLKLIANIEELGLDDKLPPIHYSFRKAKPE